MSNSEKAPLTPETTQEKKPIHIALDNKLYDLTHFAEVHPGGREILEDFHETDASQAFYAIHSKDAAKMLDKLKHRELPPNERLPKRPYLDFVNELEAKGLFKPNYFIEALLIGHTLLLFAIAIILNEERPFLSACFLGIATLTAGWVGHHLDHSRDSKLRDIGNWFSPITLGFSLGWWSEKHNRHHVSCNETEKDGDIQLMPFLWLWTPKKTEDNWNRRFQHVYFGILYMILHYKWQFDSVVFALKHKRKFEIKLLAVHFLLYVIFFKARVVFLGILISGTLSAFVVTASHQSEEKIYSKRELVKGSQSHYEINDYALQQLVTTRNITTPHWLLNYLCGGMQFQIEHHLFPRMPLYRLSEVRPYVQDYCERHNIRYKEEGFWEMMVRNYKTIHTFAALEL